MAASTCIKCDSNRFEMVDQPHVPGSEFKVVFVQCANCGGVVGAMDYYNIGNLVRELAEKLNIRLSE